MTTFRKTMIIITLMKSKIKWNGILTENNAKKVGGQKLLFHRDQQEFAFFQLKKIYQPKWKSVPLSYCCKAFALPWNKIQHFVFKCRKRFGTSSIIYCALSQYVILAVSDSHFPFPNNNTSPFLTATRLGCYRLVSAVTKDKIYVQQVSSNMMNVTSR